MYITILALSKVQTYTKIKIKLRTPPCPPPPPHTQFQSCIADLAFCTISTKIV